MKLISASLAFTLLFARLLCGAETNPAALDTSFPLAVQRTLGLPSGKGDFLPQLAEAQEKWRAKPDSSETYQAIDKLVTALNGDIDADKLDNLVLEKLKISDSSDKFRGQPDWKLGGFTDTQQLAAAISKMAETVAAKDGQKGAKYARGAALLASMTHLKFFGTTMHMVVKDRKEFGKLAQLSDVELEKFGKVIDDYDAILRAYHEKLTGVLVDQDTLIGDSKTSGLDVNTFNDALKQLSDCWPTTAADRGMRIQFLRFVWEYLNLAYVRNQPESATKLKELVDSWKNSTEDKLTGEWLKEVISVRGGAPQSHVLDASKLPKQ